MRRTSGWTIGGLLTLVLVGRPLGAQRVSALDVGFTLVRFPDDSAVVFGPSIGLRSVAEGRRLFGEINVGGVGTVGAATGSASATCGVRVSPARAWLAEGAGELFGVTGSSSRSAGTATASTRVMRAIGRTGAWVGGSASIGRREAGNLPARAVQGGLWWGSPRARLTAVVTEQEAKGQLFSGEQRQFLIGTVPVRYAEGTIGLHLESDRASLDVDAGARRDPDAASLYEPTLMATAAIWHGSTRAFTVSVARQPPDFVHGADAARWIGVGMRFLQPTPASTRAERARPVVQVVGAGDARVVRVRAADVGRVELMADFTDWQPVTLARSALGFEQSMQITAGSHRILVRIDGGEWRPAANTPAVNDDLGGRVGLLVVQ